MSDPEILPPQISTPDRLVTARLERISLTPPSSRRTAARRAVIQRVRVADRPVVPQRAIDLTCIFMQHRPRNQRPHMPPTERWAVGRFCLGGAGRTVHMVA
jgi:hypothetical protein